MREHGKHTQNTHTVCESTRSLTPKLETRCPSHRNTGLDSNANLESTHCLCHTGKRRFGRSRLGHRPVPPAKLAALPASADRPQAAGDSPSEPPRPQIRQERAANLSSNQAGVPGPLPRETSPRPRNARPAAALPTHGRATSTPEDHRPHEVRPPHGDTSDTAHAEPNADARAPGASHGAAPACRPDPGAPYLVRPAPLPRGARSTGIRAPLIQTRTKRARRLTGCHAATARRRDRQLPCRTLRSHMLGSLRTEFT